MALILFRLLPGNVLCQAFRDQHFPVFENCPIPFITVIRCGIHLLTKNVLLFWRE